MLKRFWLLILLISLVMPLKANAYIKLDFKGFIADEANVLSEQVKTDLNMTLWDLQKKSGADIAVVIVNSLNGRYIEDVAVDIGRTYKVGAKEKNNGIVFLTSVGDREMRIELGYGLENKINIASLNNIRDYDILPYYKKGDYENGVARGAYKLAELTASVENVELKQQGTCPERVGGPARRSHTPWWAYLFAFCLAIFLPKRRKTYGSFGGFGGGGGFGGSGSTGRW